MIADWSYPKQSLRLLAQKLADKYALDKGRERIRIIDSSIKTVLRCGILLVIAYIFIHYYAKCVKQLSFAHNLAESKYLSNFTKAVLPHNTTIRLRIPFCSCLFEDGHY